jgi:hypothetical protein
VVGDVLDRHVDAVGGEELARAGDEPLTVAARIATEGLDGTHRTSMPENGVLAPLSFTYDARAERRR